MKTFQIKIQNNCNIIYKNKVLILLALIDHGSVLAHGKTVVLVVTKKDNQIIIPRMHEGDLISRPSLQLNILK